MTQFTRRSFSLDSLVSLLAAATTTSVAGAAFAQSQTSPGASTRRDVIKQALPGEPPREITLVEVTYPPGAGSPAHSHANGVMAFVISGTITSKVGDEPERTLGAGSAWWEPPGAIHRVSRNASSTEPATLLAIYIASKGATPGDLMKSM